MRGNKRTSGREDKGNEEASWLVLSATTATYLFVVWLNMPGWLACFLVSFVPRPLVGQ